MAGSKISSSLSLRCPQRPSPSMGRTLTQVLLALVTTGHVYFTSTSPCSRFANIGISWKSANWLTLFRRARTPFWNAFQGKDRRLCSARMVSSI